jgi:hypothetical protein
LVGNLIEERAGATVKKEIPGKEAERPASQKDKEIEPGREEEFLLDAFEGDEEDEIIDLIDIVEEPESRMSINDFVSQPTEESYGDISPLESWNRMEEAEKPEEISEAISEKISEKTPEEIPFEKEFELSLTEQEVPSEKMDLTAKKEAARDISGGPEPEDELFKKIEIKDILARVEALEGSIEKEWPEEMRAMAPKKTAPPPKETVAPAKEAEDRFPGLQEFEFALRGEVRPEPTKAKPEGPALPSEPAKWAEPGIGLQPISPETLAAAQAPVTEETALEEESLLEEEGLPEEVRPEEIGPQEALPKEEALGADELEEEPLPEEEIVVAEGLEEESLDELAEEEFPEELLTEALEEAPGEEAAPEVTVIEEFTEKEPEKITEPVTPFIITPVIPKEEFVEAEKPREELREELKEEVREEIKAEVEGLKPFAAEDIRIDHLTDMEPPGGIEQMEQKAAPPVKLQDRHLEEIISKGIEEMVGEFITKILPDMTQNILGLTVERIEKMVREVVPEMTEKAIREEIKRLQRGEKD